MKFKHQAELLLELRERHGMTQKKLAKVLGVHTQLVSNIERGLAGIPPKRHKRIKKYLPHKDEAFQCYLRDMADQWMNEAGEKYE